MAALAAATSMGVPYVVAFPFEYVLDSCKTSDCQVEMHEEIFEQEALGYRDYLAEVLRVWDCDAQAWVPEAPAILRFENEDVVVRLSPSKDDGCEVTFLEGGESGLLDAAATNPGGDRCLCWRHWSIGSKIIGQKVSVEDLLGKIQR